MDKENMESAQKPGFYPYVPATILKVTGEDALTFLQGQFTGDLRGVGGETAVYGLWLNQKGKVIADSTVFAAREGGFWVVSYFSPARTIVERLEAYVIADDVTLEDASSAWAGVALVGLEPDGAFPLSPVEGIAFPGRRGPGKNLEWLFPAGSGEAVRAKLLSVGRQELTFAEMEQRRIGSGIPAIPQDIGLHELPNEGGLEEDAISYTKGCYLGQEVMARLKAMGQVRRRLLRVVGKGEAPPLLPAPVFLGQRQIGELRSVVRDGAGNFLGLALLSLLHLGGGNALAFSPDGSPALQVVELP